MSSRNPTLSRLRTEFGALDAPAQVGLVVGVALELAAKISTWADLRRRPARDVRGPKWAWALAQFINGLGPAAYWMFGRR